MLNLLRKMVSRIKREFYYYFCDYNDGYSAFPSDIYITISNRCNMKCKTCDVGQKEKDTTFYKSLVSCSELSLKQWMNFIDQVYAYKPNIVLDTVEPLLYKEIVGIITYIKKKGLSCSLTTNGFLLEQYADSIAKSGLDRLNVSIDGVGSLHDGIRGVDGAFERAINGIKKLTYNRKRPKIGIHYTISNYNFSALFDTISIIDKTINWDFFLFIHPSFVTKEASTLHNRIYGGNLAATPIDISGIDLEKVDLSKLKGEIEKVKLLYKAPRVRFHPDLDLNQLEIYYKKPENFIGRVECRSAWLSCNITSNGDVIPGNRCEVEHFGNILNDEFIDIWNNVNFRGFRKKIRRVKSFPICSRCNSRSVR